MADISKRAKKQRDNFYLQYDFDENDVLIHRKVMASLDRIS